MSDELLNDYQRDWDIEEAMLKYGGSFVQNLAICLRSADASNKARLKAAFPELWMKYSDVADFKKKAEVSR